MFFYGFFFYYFFIFILFFKNQTQRNSNSNKVNFDFGSHPNKVMDKKWNGFSIIILHSNTSILIGENKKSGSLTSLVTIVKCTLKVKASNQIKSKYP